MKHKFENHTYASMQNEKARNRKSYFKQVSSEIAHFHEIFGGQNQVHLIGTNNQFFRMVNGHFYQFHISGIIVYIYLVFAYYKQKR